MSARSISGSLPWLHCRVTFSRWGGLCTWLATPVLVCSVLSGCGGSNREESGQTDADDSSAADDAMTRKLEEKDVKNYMGAFKDLKELGALTEQALGDDPSDLRQLAASFSFPGKWESALKKHGFDSDSFSEVHVAVIGALGALMSEDMKAQFEEQRKKQAGQIEEMKKVLSPEQLAELEKGMEEAEKGMLSLYEDVPKANIELVRKYRKQLEAALK